MTRITIIVAGIVGCALAKELSQENSELFVLEKNKTFGEETTSRNSGEIHAGLYYPKGSLKSKLCQEGRDLLYPWCQAHDVPHQKTQKLIIASDAEEEGYLEKLHLNALGSGIQPSELIFLSEPQIHKISPHIKGTKALLSKQTGIIDPMRLCQSFYAAAVNNGAHVQFQCAVKGITKKEHYHIQTSQGEIESDIVMNAAGLYADEIAKMVGIEKYRIYPWRGDYFKIRLPYSVPTLVYPVKRPKDSGLGVHLTFNTAHEYFLGPDSEPAISKEDFTDKPQKLMTFYEKATRLFSDITPDMLSYDFCGIRPKLRSFSEDQEKDFVISQDLPGFYNLLGIESPGLTASLAIARHLKERM